MSEIKLVKLVKLGSSCSSQAFRLSSRAAVGGVVDQVVALLWVFANVEQLPPDRDRIHQSVYLI